MADFGRGRLCAPITDDDLRTVDYDSSTQTTTVTMRNRIYGEVSGLGTFSAEVALPVTDAGLDYGYYTDATGEADSWAVAVKAALDAADPGGSTWTITELGAPTSKGNVTRYVYTRDSGGLVRFLFGNVLNTIDANLLGFDNTDTLFGLGAQTAPYACTHCWRPGILSWVTTEPLRNINQVKTASVKTSNSITGGTQYREIIPSRNMPIAKVLLAGTVHELDTDAVPNLSLNDPNYPLEALWELAWDHLPLKWLPDETLPGENIKLLQVDGGDSLSEVRSIISPLGTNNRYFDVDLPLIQWEPIGGKEFDIHAVVCSGGEEFVDYDTFYDASQAEEGSLVRVTQLENASKNIPGLVFEGRRTADPWFFDRNPMLQGAWAFGTIDSEVGAPGSGRLLVYRAVDGTPFTFNPDKTVTCIWSSTKGTVYYMSAGGANRDTVGIEVQIPVPFGCTVETCTVHSSNGTDAYATIAGGAHTNSDWLGILMSRSGNNMQRYGVIGNVAYAQPTSVPSSQFVGKPVRYQWVWVRNPVTSGDSLSTRMVSSTNTVASPSNTATGSSLVWIANTEAGSLVYPFYAIYSLDTNNLTTELQTIGSMDVSPGVKWGGTPI